ncbi:hypothetical protein [Deinococcus depolymerans]|uniref:hypothetical protein n=1 Tax=Deinococcus depolymerans TaxID=392408 RepID=UPI0030A4DEF4
MEQRTAVPASTRPSLRPTTPPPGYILNKTTGTPRTDLDNVQLRKARAWYQANAEQYTPEVIRQIQKKLDLPQTGIVDHAFLNNVGVWQASFDLLLASGRGIPVSADTESFNFPANGVLTPEQLAKMFPSGLSRPESMIRYVKDIEKIVQNWDTLDTAGKRASAIKTLLNQYSQGNGFPAPNLQSVQMNPGRSGSFSSTSWRIKINAASLNDTMNPEQIRETMATLYHEARHAEQNFMSVRLMLGAGMTPAQIGEQTGIPKEVITAAARKPVNPASVQGIVANEFYQSSFGAYAKARNKTMSDLNTRYNEMLAARASLSNLEEKRRKAAKALASAATPTLRTERQQDMQQLDAQISAARTREATATRNYNTIYAAYRALPGERDAWDAEGALPVVRYRNGIK